MKYFFSMIFSVFVLCNTFGVSLELQTSKKIEKIENINYEKTLKDSKYGYSAKIEYNAQNEILFLTLISDVNTVSQKINTSRNNSSSQHCVAFNKMGRFIDTIGKSNSYSNGGIIEISNIYSNKDTLYIYDASIDRISVFNIKTTRFEYSIDLKKQMQSYSFIIIKDILLGSKPSTYLRQNDNVAFIAKIFSDKKFPKSKEIEFIRSILPCTEYRNLIGYDYVKDFENSGFDVNKKDKDSPNLKYIWETIATDGIYSTVLYENSIDAIYASNIFGTDLFKFNYELQMIDSIRIEEFNKFRKKELNIYKNIKNRKTHFSDRYSRLEDIIVNDEKNWVILFYKLTSEIAKTKGFDKYISIYSEKEKQFILDVYPIDFIPIESYNDQLIGIKFIKEQPCLEHYQIK